MPAAHRPRPAPTVVEAMAATAVTTWFARDRLAGLADRLAIAVAVSLPWSTSATGILIVLWLAALVPTLDRASVRRALAHPAGGLPVALWAFVVIGMLWADVSWSERVAALRGAHKLLMIPLLLVQFRRSDKGPWVLAGFLASCTVLLVVSFASFVWPSLLFWRDPARDRYVFPGVPLKDYLVQSGEFLLCAFALAQLAIDDWTARRRGRSFALAALAFAFLVNIAFVATGRSTLLVMAALVVITALQRFGWRGSFGIVVGAALLAALAFVASHQLRGRVLAVLDEVASYRTSNAENSSGYRLEFWKKSIAFIADAPIVGHGTGTIRALFRGAAVGDSGASATVTGNPHNMTLQVAIELGVLGVAVLYAMWAAHLMLFGAGGGLATGAMAARLGLGVVVWDVVSAVFLSHVFDFSTGWIYVFGVGVLGGMVLSGEGSRPVAAHTDAAGSGWRPVANAAKE
jgi:O-antigen ligase